MIEEEEELDEDEDFEEGELPEEQCAQGARSQKKAMYGSFYTMATYGFCKGHISIRLTIRSGV